MLGDVEGDFTSTSKVTRFVDKILPGSMVHLDCSIGEAFRVLQADPSNTVYQTIMNTLRGRFTSSISELGRVVIRARIQLGGSAIMIIYVVNEMQVLDESSRFPYHCFKKNVSHGKSIKMSPQVPINGFTKQLMYLV